MNTIFPSVSMAIATCVTAYPASFSSIQANTRVDHTIEIEFGLKNHSLRATDHLVVPLENAEKLLCFVNRSFQIQSVSALNRKLDFSIKSMLSGNAQQLEIVIPPDFRDYNELVFDIVYEGHLAASPGFLDREDVGETTGIISENGVYLSPASLWYPDIPSSLGTFKVTTITPAGYETVTQGMLVDKKTADGRTYTTWEEKNISEGCHLVAGKYEVTHRKHNNIEIFAFFFPEEQGLASTYIDATIRYLAMYQKLLGNYPYGKFAIVENFFQTGYGMPSFTLLGSAVVRLPFIVETSLGHEILHNWWGNSVFVDKWQGNWCEGLTTYMADYYYKELSSAAEAEAYRKDICRKYTNYVNRQNDFPLTRFIGRTDKASQAIGYGKTAMVFHMLRQMVGDEMFYQSLRRFYQDMIWQRAGWEDIQRTFEDVCKMDLSWFFEQWINREGAPSLELGETSVKKIQDGWITKAGIFQTDKPYRFILPVYLKLDDEDYFATVEMHETFHTISIQTKSRPRYIAIDPDQHVFRRLSIEEIPPTIDLVLGDEDRLIVYPTGGETALQAAYRKFAEFLGESGGIIKADTEITEQEIIQKSLCILGGLSENRLTKMLSEGLSKNFSINQEGIVVNGTSYKNKDDAFLIALRNPENREKGIILFAGFSPSAIERSGFKIPHYGKYSYLIFSGGKNIDKGTFPVSDSPLQRYLER